jgi:hypothetical protein
MAKQSEADLARVVVSYFQGKPDAQVYQEVLGPNGRVADIVVVSGKYRHIVETKTSFNFDVLEQAYQWRKYAHWVSVAVPRGKHARRPFQEKLCAHLGIGVLYVSTNEFLYEASPPSLLRRVLPMPLRDEQKTGSYAQAGSAGGGHWTPFRGTTDNLRAAVARSPGQPLGQYLKEIDHHYTSLSSARSSLTKWIAAGSVQGLKIQDGKVYPACLNPTCCSQQREK